jgi:A/G-specific adenine glycosylase
LAAQQQTDGAADTLLGWYDAHARTMPWRVAPADRRAGALPDPYRVWLSEIMLQQTTVAAVRAYFLRFTARWPSVAALADAADADVMGEWAGLGYYARARNLLACARVVVQRHGGVFPAAHADLLALPGVGPYTAAAIAAIAFDQPATVVDGNVERVMARLFAIDTPLPTAKPALTALAAALTPQQRPGDYAQAVMDLGATVCTPKSPACGICPWNDRCKARDLGIQASLPRKLPKTKTPTRHGTVWVARRADGYFLQERRPDRGLLGGMLGWPGSDWDGAGGDSPLAADWQLAGQALHSFTHFHLVLDVMVADIPIGQNPQRGAFMPLHPSDLPTVMHKACDVALGALSSR